MMMFLSHHLQNSCKNQNQSSPKKTVSKIRMVPTVRYSATIAIHCKRVFTDVVFIIQILKCRVKAV